MSGLRQPDTATATDEGLVSIIVPVYVTSQQQLALLQETLDTVNAQTYARYEVIVVDDGSTADVSQVTSRPAVRLIRQQNAGSAIARNTGIAAARGEFLVFLDGDDHLLPPALEVGVRHLRERPHCGFTVGPREEMTFDGQPVAWHVAPPPDESRIYLSLLAFDWYIIPPSSAMFRRRVVDAVGGFQNPWGADDLDFYLRVSYHFEAHCFSSPAVTRYRRYSASSSRDGERMLRSMRAVYERQRNWVEGDPRAKEAFARGQSQLTSIFVGCLVENVADRVRARQWRRALRAAGLLARENPRLFLTRLREGTLSPRAERPS